MYTEIVLIETIPDEKIRLKLYIEFIHEYAGWQQHLKNIGLAWGAEGAEYSAVLELKKCTEHIERLKELIV